MRTSVRKTAQLGELVAAVFDAAAFSSTDPHEVSRLAAIAVMDMLRRAIVPASFGASAGGMGLP